MPLPLVLLITAAVVASFAATTTAADALAFQLEMETMTEALRIHGSTLFTNAIATTDLQYQLLASAASSPAFTIFAPKDSLLYALDMISDSSTYISTLRYHIVPNRRHTFLHLQNLSSPFLQTLLPHYSVLVGKTRESEDIPLDDTNTTAAAASGVSIMVDGVRITSPDLFLGETLAVHGIDGILITGLNMYQDFDLDPGIVSLSSPSPTPLPSSRAESPAAAVDYSDAPARTADYYGSPTPSTWPPAESPFSSSVPFDEGMGPPVFSDQDLLDYWYGNSNGRMINGAGGYGNVMFGYDGGGNREEKKRRNVGKRKRVKRGSEKRR